MGLFMSIFLDTKYLLLISNRLPLFKKKKDTTYNCRCIFCGDSQKNIRKARGYFFHHKTDIRYKCHNCDVSISLGGFLKQIDPTLYSQYALERYSEGHQQPVKTVQEFEFEPPKFNSKPERLLDSLLVRVSQLEPEHEAVKYCKTRLIPDKQLDNIYYIDNIQNIVQLNESYKQSILGQEPRIIFPFYDTEGQLSGVTCRAIRGEALRYITIKIKDHTPLIFGLDHIDKNKPVYVVEGPIDSLFIDNCIAVAGTSFDKVEHIVDINSLVYIFDNQPRNKEVCRIMLKHIQKNVATVIWPQTISEKDINDMVKAGRNINQIIRQHTYQGLQAMVQFTAWKRC